MKNRQTRISKPPSAVSTSNGNGNVTITHYTKSFHSSNERFNFNHFSEESYFSKNEALDRSEISENTLRMLERSMKNLQAGYVSEPIDLS